MNVEADQCPGCGQPQSETTATRVDDRGRQVPAHVYDVESVRCPACAALAHDATEHKDNAAGLYHRVIKLK